jgi:hypothetical protein
MGEGQGQILTIYSISALDGIPLWMFQHQGVEGPRKGVLDRVGIWETGWIGMEEISVSVSQDAPGPAPSRSTPVRDGVLLRPPCALPDNPELSLKDPSYLP